MAPKSPSKLKLSVLSSSYWKMASVVFLIVLMLLPSSLGLYFSLNSAKTKTNLQGSYYTVVVDCGSTGTRVNVYEWERRGFDDRGLPTLVHSYPDGSNRVHVLNCQYHCMQTEPGLDKFVSNASGIRASLEPLIVWAEQWVPYERHQGTPIFILATAGLRRLPVEEALQVLDDIEVVVKEHSFVHSRSWIRVLSGEEEAYYGWVALNYKQGVFWNSSMSALGLLDLGGSSLQVVVEANGDRSDKNLIWSNIGSVNHHVLAYSFPAFGLNEAFDRTVAMLSQVQMIDSISDLLEIRHPCLGSDFVQNYACYYCTFFNVSGQKSAGSQMLHSHFTSMYMVGDPDWEQCKRLAMAAAVNYTGRDWLQLKIDTNCKENVSLLGGSSTFDTTAVANHKKQFHALSGFFVVKNTLNLSSKPSLAEIWEQGEKLCSSSQKQTDAGLLCFRGPYIASLIEHALCLSYAEIVFVPGDLSWTLGAALIEGEYLWSDSPKTDGSHTTTLKSLGLMSSPVLLFLLLVSLLIVVYYSQLRMPMPSRKTLATHTSLPSFINPDGVGSPS